jgi:hypothetical protein
MQAEIVLIHIWLNIRAFPHRIERFPPGWLCSKKFPYKTSSYRSKPLNFFMRRAPFLSLQRSDDNKNVFFLKVSPISFCTELVRHQRCKMSFVRRPVQSKDTSVMGHISKERIVQGTHCPRDTLSKGHIVKGMRRPRDTLSKGGFVQGIHCQRDASSKNFPSETQK